MNKTLRFGLIVVALSVWLCLRTEWSFSAVLSAVLYVGALWFALTSMNGSGRGLVAALFWLFFGGTYISSSVEGYAFRLLTLEQSVFVLATGAVASFLVSLGLVWASGRMEEAEAPVIATTWGWGAAIAAAFAFCVSYLLAGAMVFPKVRDFYTNLQMPPLPMLLGLQVARGLIWVAILFPCLRRIGSRGRAMAVLAAGAATLGGLAPLAAPNTLIPLNIRLWHMLEMTASHSAFGVFMVWAFVRPRGLSSATTSAAPHAAVPGGVQGSGS